MTLAENCDGRLAQEDASLPIPHNHSRQPRRRGGIDASPNKQARERARPEPCRCLLFKFDSAQRLLPLKDRRFGRARKLEQQAFNQLLICRNDR